MLLPQAQLRDVVVGAIAAAAETPPDELTDDLDLFKLGLDSLNLASILIDIEDGIGTEIPAEMLDRFLDVDESVTISDVLAVLATWNPEVFPLPGPADEIVVIEDGSPNV